MTETRPALRFSRTDVAMASRANGEGSFIRRDAASAAAASAAAASKLIVIILVGDVIKMEFEIDVEFGGRQVILARRREAM